MSTGKYEFLVGDKLADRYQRAASSNSTATVTS